MGSEYSDRTGRDGLSMADAGLGSETPSPFEWPPSAPDSSELDHDHPLHRIDEVVRNLLGEPQGGPLDSDPERPDGHRLLRCLLLQVLYGIDCDRHLLEQLRYDLRFHWFARLRHNDRPWSRTAYAEARCALLQSITGQRSLTTLLRLLRPIALTWSDHFRFDEALTERWLHDSGTPPESPEAATGRRRALLRSAGLPERDAAVDPRLIQVLEKSLPRISDPGLNPDGLAALAGMSRRALYYLFDAHGLTPTEVIRNIRLEHCKRLLEDLRHSHRKIAAIALDHGFANTYTFSRCFKQRYGIGPRDCRSDRLKSVLRQSTGAAAHA